MWYYDGHHFGGMHWLWWIIWAIIIFWIFATPYDIPGQRKKKDAPLDILKKRFASGEINKEEYEERRKIIKSENTLKKTFVLIVLGLSIVTGLTAFQQSGEWKAPASADKIANPIKGNATATQEGKKLYKQMCAICHGNTGKGDGMAGMSLNPRPANFTTEKIQTQTDGAIYWKLTEGRAPMAGYKTILKENQRWQLVNYLRTLKK